MTHPARMKYNYHHWANNRLLNHLSELPGAVYTRELESVFSTVAEVVEHLYMVDGMWLKVMSGAPMEEVMSIIGRLKQDVEGAGLDRVKQLYSEVAEGYRAFLKQDEALDQAISINHPRYGELKTRPSDLVEHVVNHGTYHRGNITAMLRQQGHAGVPSDYVIYLYELQQDPE